MSAPLGGWQQDRLAESISSCAGSSPHIAVCRQFCFQTRPLGFAGPECGEHGWSSPLGRSASGRSWIARSLQKAARLVSRVRRPFPRLRVTTKASYGTRCVVDVPFGTEGNLGTLLQPFSRDRLSRASNGHPHHSKCCRTRVSSMLQPDGVALRNMSKLFRGPSGRRASVRLASHQRSLRFRPRPLGRTLGVAVKAFVAQKEEVTYKDVFPEPMEYAALLGLTGREGSLQDSQIISAYEALVASPLENGYSRKVEEGRLVLLHAAVDGVRKIRALAGRSDRQNIAAQEARFAMVQWWLLPAALSLLQETGQPELVLEYGKLALSRRDIKPHRRDILLSMSLAHCSLSSDAFTGKEKVGLGCAHLEEALALLDEAGFQPGMSKLASEIQEGLRELKPHCIIEHLKLPIEPHTKQTRRQAIAVLKSLLANPELAAKGDGANGVDRLFVKRALTLLTSLETVRLLDWQDIARNSSTIPWFFEGLLERGATAHLVAGFVHRRPAYIEECAELLRSRPSGDLLLERVVSCVLLADQEGATELLLEAERRGFFRRDAMLADALRADSSNPGKSLALVPESADLPPRGEILTFIRQNSPGGDYDLLPGLCLFTERWLAQAAFPRFRDTARSGVSNSLNDFFESERVTSYISVKTKESDSLRDGVLVLSDRVSNAVQRIWEAPLSTRNARQHKSTELPKLALPESAGGRPRTSLFQRLLSSPLGLPQGRQAAALLMIAAASFAAVSVARRAETEPLPPAVNLTESEAPDKEAVAPSKVWRWGTRWQRDNKAAVLKPRAAEACIRRWQVAKALAMGPRHDESMLEQAVTEPYLATVRKDAASARKAGWFWSYRLSDLYVENVDNSALEAAEGEREAVVTARLREKGELFAITGKRADAHCYDNSYRAEYRMRPQPDGGWRISTVLVLGEDS